MVFNIIMSLDKLSNGKLTYALQLGDTIALTKNNSKENYTSNISKQLSDIFYNIDEEDEEPKDKKNNANVDLSKYQNQRVTRHMNLQNDEKLKVSQQRAEHQKDLLKKKNNEFRKKLENQAADLNEEVEVTKIDLSQIKCYDSKSQFPTDLKMGKIYIDSHNFTVFLPIFKQMIPFHISLIKNPSKSEDNNYTVLRLNFVIPVSNIDFGEIKGQQPVFIRDISYKHPDSKVITKILTQIRELSKVYKNKQQENKEKSD